jgi:hypothetical protein
MMRFFIYACAAYVLKPEANIGYIDENSDEYTFIRDRPANQNDPRGDMY